MRMLHTAYTSLIAIGLMATPALAGELLRVGPYDATVEVFPALGENAYTNITTITSPELDGIHASGETLDAALADYINLMRNKGYTDGLDELMEAPTACSRIRTFVTKGTNYVFMLKNFRGFEFVGRRSFLGEDLSYENNDTVTIRFLETDTSNVKEILSVSYGCVNEGM